MARINSNYSKLENSLNGLIINEYLKIWQADFGEACDHPTHSSGMFFEMPKHNRFSILAPRPSRNC